MNFIKYDVINNNLEARLKKRKICLKEKKKNVKFTGRKKWAKVKIK